MQAKLTSDELHQLKWLIGGMLTLLSLWALSGLDLIGFGLNPLMITVLCIALLRPGWVHAIPESFWSRVAVPVILVFVLIDFGLGFTSLVAPLMRMVILLLVYRTLAPRNRREDLQMLLLCLFGIIVSGALTVSLLFAIQILLFTPVAMIFLLIVCLLDQGAESANYQPSWKSFSLEQLIKRVFHVLQLRAFLVGGLLFVSVVAISAGFFILIPRFDLGQTIPFMQIDTKPRSGFSDTVSLDSVSEIIEDQSIALRIDLPDLAAIHSLPYWRILVLDNYQAGTFRLSEKKSNLRKYSKLREFFGWNKGKVSSNSRESVPWTFYFEGDVSQYLPLPTSFQTIRFTKEQAIELLPDLRVISLDAVQKSAFSYQIDDPSWAVRAPASESENEAFDDYFKNQDSESKIPLTYPLTTLDLPVDDDERALLTEVNTRLLRNTSKPSAAEYSERVTAHLRNNYRYSLKPTGIQRSGDPIVSWLVNGSAGHCELYAGAFVLLAREAGYPARMVVGYVGGSWNSVEDFFVVRNSNAHAWAEIYDAETDEWLRVDPTPGDSSADPEVVMSVSFELETGMWAWVDSLRMQWYRRVISFDQEDQVALATSLIDIGDSFLDKLSAGVEKLLAQVKDWLSQPLSYESLLRVGLILGVCFGLYYLWRIFSAGSARLLWFFGRGDALSPIRRQASSYMQKVQVKMNQTGMGDAYVETLQTLYSQLEALRFGENVSSQVAVSVFKKTRKALWQKTFRL